VILIGYDDKFAVNTYLDMSSSKKGKTSVTAAL
jgi:hypothetical protein